MPEAAAFNQFTDTDYEHSARHLSTTSSLLNMTLGPPPFRAEHIGSLLRSQRLLQKRAQITPGIHGQNEGLKQIEDEDIREAVQLQRELGFHAITDGEFRRACRFSASSILSSVSLLTTTPYSILGLVFPRSGRHERDSRHCRGRRRALSTLRLRC